MVMGVESKDNVVIKSPADRKTYRLLRLPNGLCALLVHDPEIYPNDLPEPSRTHAHDEEEEEDSEEEEEEEDGDGSEQKKAKGAQPTKKAAAAMCVGMGSFSDPFNAQGLAHFLEHMLFMGSFDFPDENEYDSYLSKHGGSSNAYTETEYTCYHFEVNREYLKGALERFSQFFISPLVKAEAMAREVVAVDSEFNQVLQSDSCRLLQLQSHTCVPDHPFNRFFWGNKKSLADAEEKGVDLREEILRLYDENYHGGMMKLVVIGGESLDILEEWVVELFSKVKDGNSSKTTVKYDMPIWKAGKLYILEAVKDVHIVELTWTLPCLHKEYLKKPEDYLSHLMGHDQTLPTNAVYILLNTKHHTKDRALDTFGNSSVTLSPYMPHRAQKSDPRFFEPADIAKLETSISIIGDKLELKLNGFNDKLSTLLSKILKLLKSFSPATDRFEVIKEVMERTFRNANMKPLNHSSYLRLQLLRETFLDVDDKLSCLLDLSLSDLKAFIPNLLSQVHIEGLCHGNLSEEEAINISDLFTNIFSVQPLPVELRHQVRVLRLPSSGSLVRSFSVKNELEVNSVVELYFQIEQDIGIKASRLRAITDLFSNIVQEPCFNQLRIHWMMKLLKTIEMV